MIANNPFLPWQLKRCNQLGGTTALEVVVKAVDKDLNELLVSLK